MATELNNYDNDYRLRYRNTDSANVSVVGIEATATDYNVAPLPPATYGMYESGAGTSASPFENFKTPNPTMTPASFAGMVTFPKNDGLGAIKGRYSLEFVNGVTGGGTAGFLTGATNPSSGDNVGDAFYNTTQDKLYVWNGTSWVDQA